MEEQAHEKSTLYRDVCATLDNGLRKVNLPSAEECARGGFGYLSHEIASLLHRVLQLPPRVPEEEIEDIQDDTRSILDNAEQAWSPMLAPVEVETYRDVNERVAQIAAQFPITPDLLAAPTEVSDVAALFSKGAQPPMLPHDELIGRIYRSITSRSPEESLDPDSAEARDLLLGSIAEAKIAAQEHGIDFIDDATKFTKFGGSYLLHETKYISYIIADSGDAEWPFTYFRGLESVSKQASTRYYVHLRAEEAEHAGAHFVRMVAALNRSGVTLLESKAGSPAHVRNRKDAMVFQVTDDDDENAAQCLLDYLSRANCGDPDDDAGAGLLSSGHGLSSSAEPDERQKEFTSLAWQTGTGSFNAYLAARALPLVLERLLTEPSLSPEARVLYMRQATRLKHLLALREDPLEKLLNDAWRDEEEDE